MCENRFYICPHCGNIVGMIHSSGAPLVCCGEPMKALEANTTEAATEKHIPVVTVEGNIVKAAVGEVTHPMTDAHHIAWVYVETDKGGHRKCLDHTAEPVLTFALTDDEKPVAVYAYCNLHGLWAVKL